MVRGDCGAEARTYECSAFGVRLIAKAREPKRYRVKALDEELRRSRTRREARILYALRERRIPVPSVVAVGRNIIYMERLEGRLLRDVRKGPAFFESVGEVVGDMHDAGVAHGDMTPANIMVVKGRPYIIDFGLAEMTGSVEEKALDLLLMKRSLGGMEYAAFLSGYSSGNRNYGKVMERLSGIEKRGRYQVRTLA